MNDAPTWPSLSISVFFLLASVCAVISISMRLPGSQRS